MGKRLYSNVLDHSFFSFFSTILEHIHTQKVKRTRGSSFARQYSMNYEALVLITAEKKRPSLSLSPSGCRGGESEKPAGGTRSFKSLGAGRRRRRVGAWPPGARRGAARRGRAHGAQARRRRRRRLRPRPRNGKQRGHVTQARFYPRAAAARRWLWGLAPPYRPHEASDPRVLGGGGCNED